MDTNKYTKKFSIHYYEMDRFKEASPASILKYLEETAISHSEAVGLGIDKLKSDNTGWVLSKWYLEMIRYPSWSDEVLIATWPSSFERFYATREFTITDMDKAIIGRASSLWIFLNIEKRRPVRIPENFGQIYGLNPSRASKSSFDGLPSNIDVEIKKEFTVRKSDIDTNEHVNNVSYVDWALEALPGDVHNNFRLNTLEVEYKKESGYGCAVYSICKEVESSCSSRKFLHNIINRDDNSILATARTVWKNI